MHDGRDADFGLAVRAALLASTCPISLWDVLERRDLEGEEARAVTLWIRLMPYLLAVAVGIGAWWYVTHLQRARDSAIEGQAATMAALGHEQAARAATAEALARSDAALTQREAAQRALEDRLRRQRGDLDATLRRPEAAPWADTRMPGDVYDRLRAAATDPDGARADDRAADGAPD